MSFELTTIGQYASVQGGYAFKSPDFLPNGFRPVLKIKNVRHGYVDYNDVAYVSEEIATSCKKWETQDGDILISMTGSGPSAPESLVGRVARVSSSEPKALINQRVGRLILKDEHAIDKDFLFYVLSQKETQEYLVSNSTGSANQVNINGKTIESVSCPKVTFEESTQIASVLRALDKQVRLLRETNATLEAIAQALFKSWFVDFDPVHANAGTQAPSLPPEIQALFPATFTDSPLGPIPDGWRISNIGEVCDFQNGYAFKSNEMSKVAENTYKIFKMGNIKKGGGLNRSGTKDYFEKNKAASLNRYLIKKGDLLMCMTDMKNNVALLGHTALMDVDNEFLLNQRVGMIRTRNPKIVNYPFLFILTNSDSFLNDIRMRANSGVQVNLSTNEIKSTEFVLPPTDIHSVFNDVVEGLFEKLFVNEQKLDYLSGLRDTLLPRLISGQLRLSEVEQTIAAITD